MEHTMLVLGQIRGLQTTNSPGPGSSQNLTTTTTTSTAG